MSVWSDSFEPGIITILQSGIFDIRNAHHFDPPYVSAYQLAVVFEQHYPDICREHRKVIGEGAGMNNLAAYIARQLSQKILMEGRESNIEGVWLSGEGLSAILYRHGAETKQGSPNTEHNGFSIFRYRRPDAE